MKFLASSRIVLILCSALAALNIRADQPTDGIPSKSFLNWASRPPMGWNSWDCFGCTVTEQLTQTNADYMATKLASHGWQYIVVDIQWYEPQSTGWNYNSNPKPVLDEYGRLLPVPEKFPSSRNGAGFKPLADYIHARNLKFGLHLIRGIPREAVKRKTPILGSSYTAADIASTDSTCKWNPDMFGVNMSKPGAQEYYDSVFKLLASWDLDFVKVDDLARPYHEDEIEAIRKAIDKCGRNIVFSMSPGATPLSQADHASTHANMWRLTDDFWDNWKLLKQSFNTCNNWTPYRAAGHWPDPDMLPLGAVRVGPKMERHWTKFTPDEQRTLMTLWSISRAPLMFGGHLPWNDDFTLSLITNDEVLAVNQLSTGNRQMLRTNDLVVWVAEIPNSADRYVALFNAQDATSNNVSVALTDLGLSSSATARDLWSGKDIGQFNDTFSQWIPPHGAGLFLLSSVQRGPTTTNPTSPSPQVSANTKLLPQSEPFPLSRVRLLSGPFKERQDINARYLVMIEPDRLLAGFHQQAGLPEKAQRYGGWEARDINGHGLGHYLSALSLQYAATGEPWALERISYIVDELAACQKANGDGYLLPEPKKVYEDIRAGKIKASAFSLNDCWVPNYTLHKVMAGLRDAYRLAGNKNALDVERRLADWLDTILSGLTDEQIQQMLRAEHGGMNEVLFDLSVDTGNQQYLQMGERDFTHKAVLAPLMRGEDRLTGLHGNTQIPKLIGLAREYELTSSPEFKTAVETFWDSVVNRRSYAIGGHGESEHFFAPERFPQELTPHTCETCNTYNMLKLTGHLFSWEPKAAEMDFVERALLNHLLANIGRQPGEFGYFLGLSSVESKVFSTQFNSWWCCVGTGMENPARYGEQIYFRNTNTLWVNLYMGSTLTWEEKGVTLRQETRFPEEETVRFIFACDKPVNVALKLRHPYWCKQPLVKINGKAAPSESSPSSYMTFERTWKSGDTIEVRLPMSLRLEPLPHSDNKTVAVMYGPLVLAGIVPPEPGTTNSATARFSDHLKAKNTTSQFPPIFVTANQGDVLSRLQPTGNAFAEFRSRGLVKAEDLSFVPFYRIYEEHYAVYFPVMNPDEWSQRQSELRKERENQAKWEAATLDTVAPGFQQSEVDHQLKSENSQTGDFGDKKWRDARGGWFSYKMSVDPKMPMALICTYWGSESIERNFDILIDGEKVATQQLYTNKVGRFFDQIYTLPPALTQDKTNIVVRLQAQAGNIAGGVFGLRTVRAPAVSQAQ